jgi:hypothetical protein
MTRRGHRRRVRDKTKNPLFCNGLASFDAAIDCAAANNRLKRRREPISSQSEFGFAPGLALNFRIKTIFLTRNDERFA